MNKAERAPTSSLDEVSSALIKEKAGEDELLDLQTSLGVEDVTDKIRATIVALDAGIHLSKYETENQNKRFKVPAINIKRVTTLVAAMALACIGAEVVGRQIAQETIEESKRKLAIPIYVKDPDSKGEAIGYMYGNRTDNKDISGVDTSIPIDPEELKENGKLYYWYQALIALEDSGHEGGASDVTGINPRIFYAIPKSAVLKVLSLFIGKQQIQGGSSIADQSCGAMQTSLPNFPTWQPAKKINETLCGIGLANLKDPREIAAFYGTYAYMAPQKAYGIEVFIRKYWDIEDIYDPKLTIGKQLVLAALLNRPWFQKEITDKTTGEKRIINNWPDLEARARVALKKLVEKGVIEEKDKEDITEEIKDSKPKDPSEVKSLSPKEGYLVATLKAIKEVKEAMGSDDDNEWRSQVKSITLTIDPNVQGTVWKKSLLKVKEVNDERARYEVLVVDNEGRIIAIDTNNSTGKDEYLLKRFDSERSPGSMGKILLAAAVSNKGYQAPLADRYTNGFYTNLSVSSAAIVEDAKKMKVKGKDLYPLISCYGNAHEDDSDQVKNAALGVFETNPVRFSTILYEAWSGKVMPEYHVVDSFETNDGKVHRISLPKKDDLQECAELIYADGRTKTWLRAPLDERGTLNYLSGIADIGKTGTIGSENDNNNNIMAWAIAGTSFGDGSFYTVIAGFGNDGNDPIQTLGTGGGVAGPVVRDILLKVEERKERKALVTSNE